MVAFALECLANVKEDIKPLIQEHWELVALNQGKIKLNPDWEEYARLDAAGVLKIFTARSDSELVGYFIVTVSRSVHYQDHLFAICDIIFVKPDKRCGATGYKLIKYAERWCAENKVSLLNINTKVHVPFDRLMEGMNFNLIERVYSKYTGE
jgi:GNAT superfamily N-acetyltransferase